VEGESLMVKLKVYRSETVLEKFN